MAGEQSTGTFVRVPGETEELRERFRARVERIEELAAVPVAEPAGLAAAERAAGPLPPGRGRAVVPAGEHGAVAARPAGDRRRQPVRAARVLRAELLDLELPPAFAAAYPGPQFGVEGTRRLAGVEGRPIIGTIIKPSVGLTPEQTADAGPARSPRRASTSSRTTS